MYFTSGNPVDSGYRHQHPVTLSAGEASDRRWIDGWMEICNKKISKFVGFLTTSRLVKQQKKTIHPASRQPHTNG